MNEEKSIKEITYSSDYVDELERKIERSMKRTQDHIIELEEEARCDGSF